MNRKFQFGFNFVSKFAYPIVFYIVKEGRYPLYFYGFNLCEIIIYTARHAELSRKERELIIERLMCSEVAGADGVNISAKSIYDSASEGLSQKLKGVPNVKVSIDHLITTLVDVLVDSCTLQGKTVDVEFPVKEILKMNPNALDYAQDALDILQSANRKGIEPNMHYEVYTKVIKIVEDLAARAHIQRIWKNTDSVVSGNVIISKDFVDTDSISDGDRHLTRGEVIELNAFVRKIDRAFTEFNNGFDINLRTLCGVETVTNLDKYSKSSADYGITRDIGSVQPKQVTPNTSINLQDRKAVNDSILNIDNYRQKNVSSTVLSDVKVPKFLEQVTLNEILQLYRKHLDMPNSNVTKIKPLSGVESSGVELTQPVTITDSEEGISAELRVSRDSMKDLSYSVLDVINKKLAAISTVVAEIGGGEFNFKGSDSSSDVHQHTRLDCTMDTYVPEVDIPDPTRVEVVVEVDRQKEQSAHTVVDTLQFIRPYATPVVPINHYKEQGVDTVVDIDTHEYVSVSGRVDVRTGEYKDIRLGRRWKMVTGDAWDKIWLNPIKDDFIFQGGEVAVEGKISFKAMLNFILFVEQLMHVNRFNYAASRAVTAINDVVRILQEWLTESRPEEELPKEYEYLYRWFKWFADGKLSKFAENMELNGLEVIGQIRDQMVEYFNSRWGKRVVKHGKDGMLIYSNEYSYLDRLRGKKHGYAHRLVDRDNMADEYGVDEYQLPFDIDTETKGIKTPPEEN